MDSSPEQMGKPAVVSHRDGLEEEVGEALCGPCLSFTVETRQLIIACSLALMEEFHCLVSHSTTIFDSKRENLVRTHITVHCVFRRLSSSSGGQRDGGGTLDMILRDH